MHDLCPVFVGQHVIQDEQVWQFATQLDETQIELLCVAEALALVPDLIEDRKDRVSNERLVVDDPDTRHRCTILRIAG
jgi:hypothetical protein